MSNPSAQNPQSIQKMFSVISKRYDLANSILSLGIHHLWKKRLIRESQLSAGQQVLDCATGTGDLAFLFEKHLGKTGHVTGSDFCESMLEVAYERAKRGRSRVQFEVADVMNLPYANASFDIASISFGIRNTQDAKKALCELGRVVKPGGRVLVLEFGQPRSKWMGALYHIYSTRILPKLGGWISGQPEAYQYLQTSSAQFPCRDHFLELARSTEQFSRMRYISFQTGIAYLYVLEK